MNRRGFFKLLGVAPVAAKAAADAEIAKVTTLGNGFVAPHLLQGANGGGFPGSSSFDNNRLAAAAYMKLKGLPEHVREQLWRNATYVGALDPDLAALKSFSMSVKILTQRERNFQRALEAQEHSFWYARASGLFRAATGWDWPW